MNILKRLILFIKSTKNPKCKIDPDGTKRWFLNGLLHREDGPAVEFASGSNSWYVNDKLHREDGPAVEYSSGEKYWYINGKFYTEKNYYEKIYELGKMSEEDYFLVVL